MTDASLHKKSSASAGMPSAQRRQQARESRAFRVVSKVTHVLDDYHLDPIVGLIPVVGDVVTALSGASAVVVSAFILRSFPLTLAVIFNVLVDLLLGIVPVFVGDVVDFFFRSNRRNVALIRRFIDGDVHTVQVVRRRAWLLGGGIVVLLVAIVALATWLLHVISGFIFG